MLKGKIMNKLVNILCGLIICCSCTQTPETEKHQKKRDNILNVHERVTKIDMEATPLTGWSAPEIMSEYLLVSDYKSPDKLIYLFDKNTFTYVTSTGDRGQGPGEISNMGSLSINEKERIFYITDHGHQKVYAFYLDSVLADPFYLPVEKTTIKELLFPTHFQYVSDTLSYGLFLKIKNAGDYTPVVAKWNMMSGDVEPMKYITHPDIERKRASFAASVENGIYVECYWHHDLMTIGTLEGEFKCNVYGPVWTTETSNRDLYYEKVAFCRNKIVASYLAGERLTQQKKGEIKSNYPDKFLIFDLEGNYLQTLETGYSIKNFCYDEENNRLILALDDDSQFGYLDMKGIL